MKSTFGIIGRGMLLTCFFVWTVAWAAESAKSPSQAGETKSAAPTAVAIADSEIIPRAEQTVKLLQKIGSDVATNSILRSIENEFSASVAKSERRWESDAGSMGKIRSMQRVSEIQRDWNLERAQLDDWDRALAARSQVLAAQDKDVDRIIETWRATQVAVAKKFFFKAVLQRRVEEVLKEAQATHLAIQGQTTKVLKLQSQIADRLAALADIRKEIDQVREELGRSLFKLDAPPLWQALIHPEEQGATKSGASDGARWILDDLQTFSQKYDARIPWHLSLFVAILALFQFYRRGPTPEVMAAPSAIQFLDRPVASAFLLLLLSSLLFYPAAAALILRSAAAITVIPIIRLLPGLLPKIQQRWLYMFVALYVLDFLRYLLPQDWLLTRLLLLSIAAGGLVGIGLFLRSRKSEPSVSSVSHHLLSLTFWFVVFLFALSAVSNIVGNLSLAEFLVDTPVRITYNAALLFAAANLLTTIVALLLQLPAARWLRSVREHSALLASRCRTLIGLAAVVAWVLVSLYMLGVLDDLFAAIEAFLQLRWKLGAAEISIQDLAAFLAVLVSAVLVSRMIRFVLAEEILPRIRLPRGVPSAVDVLSRYGIMLLGFLIALAAAGVDFSKVTLLISALGVGIGFGLQNVVNNFVSGLILVFEHPIQVGDSVEVGTTFGEVRKIGFRASVLRTPDGADVIIPNSELTGSRVINWSLFDRLRRISVSVSAAYGTDPNQVIEILVDIARKHPAVLAHPAPMAVFDRFTDSSLSFTLLCWSDVDQFFLTRSELTIAINAAFDAAGIQIPFPQRDVHLHLLDEPGFVAAPSQKSEERAQKQTPPSTLLLSGERPVAKK